MRHLRRKLTLRTRGEQVVFVKRAHERIEHVWMKAFLWALYLPAYPELSVEISVNARYKPDVVATDPLRGTPLFWGEAGHVSRDKIAHLVRSYPETHLAIAKWDADLTPTLDAVVDAVHEIQRAAPVDLIRFPSESADRFVTDRGEISLSWDALSWIRVGNATAL